MGWETEEKISAKLIAEWKADSLINFSDDLLQLNGHNKEIFTRGSYFGGLRCEHNGYRSNNF